MSRCFPYPPPGYEAKNRDQGLIESIKLQKEREKAKKERRKEKKRLKKEKREKSRENDKLECKEHHAEKCNDERSTANQRGHDYEKTKYEEVEQVEKSSLTEEHESSASAQILYDSSDSMTNNGKRKKHATDSNTGHSGGGRLIIRLPAMKHRGGSEPPSSGQPACTSGMTEIPPKDGTGTSDGNKSNASGSSLIAEQESDLMWNWNPLLLLDASTHIDDDQEWLFVKGRRCNYELKRLKIGDGSPSPGIAVVGPHACYLPAADVYALPYVIPY